MSLTEVSRTKHTPPYLQAFIFVYHKTMQLFFVLSVITLHKHCHAWSLPSIQQMLTLTQPKAP